MKRGDNMKTAAARAISSQRMRANVHDPRWRLKAGFLLPHEREQIIQAASTGRPFVEIALDWNCTISNICHIARAAGLSRQRPRIERGQRQ